MVCRFAVCADLSDRHVSRRRAHRQQHSTRNICQRRALVMQRLREEGGDGDSYVPGKVSLPAGAGRVVQVSAGAPPLCC